MIEETDEQLLNRITDGNFVGLDPARVMLHGPTKLLIDAYYWHSPNKGIVAGYAPTERDVEDHFGIFRGVDQIEAFALASIVSCCAFLECRKLNCLPDVLKENFIPAFVSVGQVIFHYYLEFGDRFISMANIKSYKWRQMVCDGRIYKVPKDLDFDAYFSDFTEERLLNYDTSKYFKLVAELFDITGRAIKKEIFKQV